MLTYIQIKLSGVGLGFASFLGGVGIGAGAASKKTQINLKIKKNHTIMFRPDFTSPTIVRWFDRRTG